MSVVVEKRDDDVARGFADSKHDIEENRGMFNPLE